MKTLFIIKPHSVIDVITNSSSELFIGKHNSKDLMIEMIRSAYPAYRAEYDEVKTIDQLDDEELEMYISYHYEYWSNREQETIRNVIDGFTEEEMYVTKEFNGHEYTYLIDDFVKYNRERIIQGIDPDKEMFFMFSYDENPDWDAQELLSNFMTRYHLG